MEKPVDTAEDESWGEMTSEAINKLLLVNAPSNVFLRHPLFRRIYLFFFVLTTIFILVPMWTIIYLLRGNRPRTSWTLERCLRVRFSRRLCGLVARCELDYLGRDLSVDLLHESRGSWNPHFIHRLKRDDPKAWGRWNAENERSTKYGFEQVKAFWFTGEKATPDEGGCCGDWAKLTRTGPKPRLPGDPVMIHFHGGGYLCGTAAETDLTSSICKSLVKHSPIHHVLSVDYRLAPTGPWPIPLLDAITTYYHLVKVEHIPERDIVIGGDSAGGHLALALVRWLRDSGSGVGLKMPRGVVLMSPWSDVGFTNAWGAEAVRYNADSDVIEDTFGPFACSLLLRALPASTIHTSSYLSPASKLLPAKPNGPDSFEHFPPTYIVYGDAERLVTSIKILWDRIQLSRQDEKTVVPDRLFCGPDAVHDFMIFPWMAQEAAMVYEDLDVWLRELLAADLGEDDEEEEIPTSPEEAQSPDWKDIALQRRLSRKKTRESIKSAKSPTMGPVSDESGVMRMVEDMREEGMSMIDVPAFDLDLSPFVPQHEDGEYDWEEGQKPWYEIDGGGSEDSGDDAMESRKNR
ncbi:hypothetical protein CI109_104232 [Kwoniella shandongensis]|uniref:Alpha/beta hydrolase fold-3 domain-containing protein n=1 Tax=Kwoniella shandongensis TaxID=1734106 RepID=A0AAJ8LIA3_9TREE